MDTWRLLEYEKEDDSYGKMALDEAVLDSVAQGESPATLRFYHWPHPAVAIGYFQAVEEEVNTKACRQDRVEIFRRMTGGGAVYKDPAGELNYSLIIKESDPRIPQDILASYGAIEQGLIKGLEFLGLNAQLTGVNDIVLDGKKISGNAQTRKNGAVLQHGTLLLDFDVEKMAAYLKISQEKLSDKNLQDIRKRVGTLREYLPEMSLPEMEKALIEGFRQAFKTVIKPGKISKREQRLKKDLYKQKYSTYEWNYRR
ncbi:MAG: lipoate--protein ligase family protein [Patescibacteria group bacterium]